MVSVIVSSDSRYKINKPAIQNCIINLLASHKITGNVEVEVAIVGDRKMHDLNKHYRKIDDTTDVLSFSLVESGKGGFVSLPDKTLRLGSIVVSYPQAIVNAMEKAKSVEEEINFLVEHGLSHLLGIHHE